MPFFPMFIDIERKECVIIGAGVVAFRKVEALLEFGANITVIGRKVCNEIYALEDKIHIYQKDYETTDIEQAYLVVAATNDTALNARISIEAQSRKIPVNVVDVMEECTFIFPAYIKRGDIAIGITSSGKSPLISQKIKRMIEHILPPFLEELTNTLGEVRQRVKNIFLLEEERKRVFKKIVEKGFLIQDTLKEEDITNIIENEKKQQVNGGRHE